MPEADSDRDLRSIRQARELARAAKAAQQELEKLGQEQVDAVVEAMAAAGLRESERLARMAHDETGFGNVPDKTAKNNFVLEDVVEAMRGMRTVGVLREDPSGRVVEIAEPVGVVAGIIPSTNPTSTAIFKCLIALKARCGIVLSPHPSAKECIRASAEVMHEAAAGAGAPRGIIGCMTEVTMEGTHELMRGRDTDLILATGGMRLVKAAYSAGKPAYGVGPGNVPSYIEGTADVAKAVRDTIAGTTFDYGTLCSSEQALICDRAVAAEVRRQVEANRGHFLDPDEVARLSPVVITEEYLVNPAVVGRPATAIAEMAGIRVPPETSVLICSLEGVGKEYPLSHEKLSPVLAYYEVEDWREGCERCTQLLRFGGLGHTLVIHSQDQEVIMEFGLRKPAHRVLVNTMAAMGAVGHTTNLFPSMTLGCGAWGNNITSDNVGPQHLINVKRLAYETRPWTQGRAAAGQDTLESRVVSFLSQRGILERGGAPPPGAGRTTVVAVKGTPDQEATARAAAGSGAPATAPVPPRGASGGVSGSVAPPPSVKKIRSVTGRARRPEPVEFVSESDVRAAMERGEKIPIGPHTLITPLARELGQEHGVFERR